MDGQTPGKRLHRIRVVREGGYSVTFGVSAVRNLIRIIDMQPGFFYLVGMVSVLLTKRGRRLGDLVAGTIVVREDVRAHRGARPPRSRRRRGAPPRCRRSSARTSTRARPLRRALGDARAAASRRARRSSSRRGSRAALPDDGRAAGAAAARAARARAPARARGGVASRGETGAGRERQALIAAGMPRWTRIRRRRSPLAQKQGTALARRGGRARLRRRVPRAVRRSRAAAHRAGGRALDELFYLGRLVAGAHNLLYRDRGMPLRAARALPLHRRPARGPPFGARRSRSRRCCCSDPRSIAGVAVIARVPTLASKLLPRGHAPARRGRRASRARAARATSTIRSSSAP